MVYGSSNIRNILLLGHGNCGKTTLVEACAYITKAVNRMGKVEEGNTISDYDKEEIKRGFSISMVSIPIVFDNIKINILDTPGYFDFYGEVYEALEAADGAVIVVSGKNGIEAGTIKAWELCEKKQIPVMFVVTHVEEDSHFFYDTLEELILRFGKKAAPFYLPLKKSGEMVGIIEWMVTGKIPEIPWQSYDNCMEFINEIVAETSDELMVKYFNGDEFSKEEINNAMINRVKKRDILPVIPVSGISGIGIKDFLKTVNLYFPSPIECMKYGINDNVNKKVEIYFDEKKPVSLQVFKTISNPYIGKYSLYKVVTGVLKRDVVLLNSRTEEEVKVSKIFYLFGGNLKEVDSLCAGDIGVFVKLDKTRTFDTFVQKNNKVKYLIPNMPVPYTYFQYEAKNKGEDDKISMAFAKLLDEDLTLKMENDPQNQQSLIYGMGDLHIQIVMSKLYRRYHVEVAYMEARVPYKETITKKVSVRGRYKKQSGGHGQFGDVYMDFEPLDDYKKDFVFEEKIFGGAVPKNYFPAIEKGIVASMNRGSLAGFCVTGIKAVLTDGSYHSVDSSEYSFKMAAILACKEAFLRAEPVLLEPIVELSVDVPDQYVKEVMGDFHKRGGRVLGMEAVSDGRKKIICEMPLSETFGYCTVLRSMTGGMGDYFYHFVRYEKVSYASMEKIIKKYNKNNE